MEKIYMEDNNRRNRKPFDFSIVLSFAVAIFAIFSIATYGVVSNQGMDAVSYAVPVSESITSGNSFEFTLGTNAAGHLIHIKGVGNGSAFQVPIYLADGSASKPVFCVEHNVDPPTTGVVVQKDSAIEDYGLLYILNNTMANGKKVTSVTGEYSNYVETWVTQVAIWMYLYEKNGATAESNPHYIDAADVASIKATNQLFLVDPLGDLSTGEVSIYTGSNLYTAYVEELVNSAKQVSGVKLFSLDKAQGEIAKTTDGKYYQTPLISAHGNPPSDLTSYDITLSGFDGAFLVDEDGKTLNGTGIAPGKSFYVRIPADKVTETAKDLNIGTVGHFDTLAGNYFVSQDASGESLQKVVTVTGATRDVSTGLVISVVGAPDTGMNTAQTIYFIGLIVLLCGVGIVYANAKPVENKQ